MTRRALVTGGAGFLGSHLVERLLAEGWSVRVLDDLSSGREENLAAGAERAELIRGDVSEGDTAERAAEGADAIFHLAAVVSVVASVGAPRRTDAVNVGGTLAVLDAARKRGVRRLVLAGSAAAYGERASPPLAEALPPDPRSPYALQKLAAELYCGLYHRLYGLETVALRFFNVYGPRQDPGGDYAAVIPAFIGAALRGEPLPVHGDGEQTRDFVYVSDAVEALLRAATVPAAAGRVLNVGSGEPTSISRLAEVVARAASRRSDTVHRPARPGDVRHSWADLARAREVLGIPPAVSLKRGIRLTVEAFAGGRA